MTVSLSQQNPLAKIKQPEPQVVKDSAQNAPTNAKRTINRPKVGVVSPYAISKTPLADTLTKNEKENPRMKYRFIIKRPKLLDVQNFLTAGITFCGIASLISLLKK